MKLIVSRRYAIGRLTRRKGTFATEITSLVYDPVIAKGIEESARTTFEEGGLGATLPIVNSNAILEAPGLSVLGAFVLAGLVSSNGEARRQIKNGGLKVNDMTVTDEKMLCDSEKSHGGRRNKTYARPQASRAAQAGVTDCFSDCRCCR